MEKKKKKFPFKKEFPRKDEYFEKAFLDFRKLQKEDYAQLTRLLKKFNGADVETKALRTPKDLVKKNLSSAFIGSYGKVGFMKLREDGTTQFVVTDMSYLLDREYRTSVNKSGYRPVFQRKILMAERNGKIIKMANETKKITKNLPGWRSSKNEKDTYLRALSVVSKKMPVKSSLIRKSILRMTKSHSPDRAIKGSVEEGIRQAILNVYATKFEGKMCRMTATHSDNPDLEHALLEWKIMPCAVVFEHLSRLGCKHDFEVMDAAT